MEKSMMTLGFPAGGWWDGAAINSSRGVRIGICLGGKMMRFGLG